MKKTIVFAIILILGLTAISSSCIPSRAIEFDLRYHGNALPKPVDVNKLEAAVASSLLSFGWRLISTDNGKIIAKLEKPGAYGVTIMVLYSADGYAVEYIESIGLLVNMEEMRIHRNYVRWIQNLIKKIGITYNNSML